MQTVNVLPPSGGATFIVAGRAYTAADGVLVSMPYADAQRAAANGWTIIPYAPSQGAQGAQGSQGAQGAQGSTGGGGGGSSSSGAAGALQTSDGAGGFRNIGSDYVVLPGAFEAAGGFVVNPGGIGKTFYSSHGLASIGEGAFSYAGFTYAALTHTLKTGTAGDVDALVLAADGSANFPVGASVDGDDVITDATLAAALAAQGVPALSPPVTATMIDLAAFPGTEKILVPAPGVGKALVFVAAYSVNKLNGGKAPGTGLGIKFAGGVSTLDNGVTWGSTITDNFLVDPIYYSGDTETLALVENAALVLWAAAPSQTGVISASVLNSGGSGYAPGDTFTVNPLGLTLETPAVGVVDTVDGGGAVVTYHLTNSVLAYPLATSAGTNATSGVGMGFTIDITAVDASTNAATMTFQVLHAVMDVS